MTGSESSIAPNHINGIEEVLGYMEKFLDENQWIAGDALTIADLCCLATTTSINEIIPIDSQKLIQICISKFIQIFLNNMVSRYPKVWSWMENCKTLPYYDENKGVKIFGDVIRSLIK